MPAIYRINAEKSHTKAFTPQPRDRSVTPEKEESIAAALTERLSQRAVARLLKVSRDTIRRTLKKKAACTRLSDQIVPALWGDSLEIDELVVHFQVRRRYRYLWVAVSRLTRQVLGFSLGDRGITSLHALWQHVPREYRRKLIYTDAYSVYAEFFAAWQHRPSPKGSGRTRVAEGLNNKWRSRIAGLVRRTVCVRGEADLAQRLLLTFDQHNGLCRRRIEKLGWLTPSMQ